MQFAKPEHAQAFQQLRIKIETDKDKDRELFERNRWWLDDSCLRRYLAAFGWKVDKARDGIKKTLKWREDAHPENFHMKAYGQLIQTGYAYWNGYDMHGHPILYVRARMHDTSADRNLRCDYLVGMLELGIKLMDKKFSGREGVEQWVIIVDEAQKTSANNDLKLLKKLAPLMFAHYVERLFKMFIINPSSTLSMMMRIASVFIDAHTKSKLTLSNKDKAKQPTKEEKELTEKDLENIEEGAEEGSEKSPASPVPKFDANTFPELVEDIGLANLEQEFGGQYPPPVLSEYFQTISEIQ